MTRGNKSDTMCFTVVLVICSFGGLLSLLLSHFLALPIYIVLQQVFVKEEASSLSDPNLFYEVIFQQTETPCDLCPTVHDGNRCGQSLRIWVYIYWNKPPQGGTQN